MISKWGVIMNDLKELKIKIDDFSKERDWEKYHTPSNLAKSISIESAELLECFQWDDNYDINNVAEELADVLIYCIRLASVLDLDVKQIILEKMEKSALKYPKDKCFGKSDKYNKL